MKKNCCLVISLCLFTMAAYAQSAFFNTVFDSVYVLTGPPGTCSFKNVGVIGTPGVHNNIFSIAAHKDTVFYLTSAAPPAVYYFKVGNPSVCTFVTNLPGASYYNSFTIDKNGVMYFIDGNSLLLKYDSYKKIGPTQLGYLPASPVGDLIFYKNKLLYTGGYSTIYEINIAKPSASTVYMGTPNFNFIGLMSLPNGCYGNKIYGMDGSNLVELDLDNKKVIGKVCNLNNQPVYDAASSVEDGSTAGVTIDTINIATQCNVKADSTDISISAFSAATGQLTYTLDNNQTNNTGLFPKTTYGNHHVHIVNQLGCSLDSDVNIVNSSITTINLAIQNPASCANTNGSIKVSIPSGTVPPYLYAIDNGPFQAINSFSSLPEGKHIISVLNGNNCQIDTSVQLKFIQPPILYSLVLAQPSHCSANNGKIIISPLAGANPPSIKVSLNNGTPQQALTFQNLAPGNYLVSAVDAAGCRKDTTIAVSQLIDPAPTINISATAQQCFINNGKISLNLVGQFPPYSVSLDNGSFLYNTTFSNLSPGRHSISIKDSNNCKWDTSANVPKYVAMPFSWTKSITNAKCSQPNSGSISIDITGTEPPYSFQLNNKIYQSGEKISNLLYGNYIISFLNKDGCILDTASVYVDVDMSPECAQVWIPTAFTPNGDGKNDLFKPIISLNFTNAVYFIYNRYGQLLFSDTKGNGWNGTVNGIAQPAGTYVCVVKYNNVIGEATSKTGTFLLLR